MCRVGCGLLGGGASNVGDLPKIDVYFFHLTTSNSLLSSVTKSDASFRVKLVEDTIVRSLL